MYEYKPKRSRNLYEPGSEKPFKLSRSKLEMFINCPRCFYVDRRLGVKPPDGYPFTLNSAVDALLKREFDQYRASAKPHPFFEQAKVDAVPYMHPELDKWRTNFTGVQYLHEQTNLLIHGAIDDVWQQPGGKLIVADYKATSKNGEVSLDAEWQIGYKRQMEVYQWLLRRNGFDVSSTGYFVYCNGIRDKSSFDNRLEFKVSMIPYNGDDSWVENIILRIFECLNKDNIPDPHADCFQCRYNETVKDLI